MILDPWLWLILILLLLLLILLLLVFMLRKLRQPQTPVVVFSDRINVPCGTTDDVYSNFVGPMQVNVELKVGGQCAVTLSTGAVRNFLSRDSVDKTSGAAAIPLATNDRISYACKSDEAKDSRCEFTLKITRI
jgi:hypothetical protein